MQLICRHCHRHRHPHPHSLRITASPIKTAQLAVRAKKRIVSRSRGKTPISVFPGTYGRDAVQLLSYGREWFSGGADYISDLLGFHTYRKDCLMRSAF